MPNICRFTIIHTSCSYVVKTHLLLCIGLWWILIRANTHTGFLFISVRAHHQACEEQAVHLDGAGATCHCLWYGVSNQLFSCLNGHIHESPPFVEKADTQCYLAAVFVLCPVFPSRNMFLTLLYLSFLHAGSSLIWWTVQSWFVMSPCVVTFIMARLDCACLPLD